MICIYILRHFGIIVKSGQLSDSYTHILFYGGANFSSIFPKDTSNPSLTLLSEFHALTQVLLFNWQASTVSGTAGPLVLSQPRRTHAATLEIRPSSSAWAWPHHMVLGDWHPCRDCRANPVPHLHRMPQFFEVEPGACLPSDLLKHPGLFRVPQDTIQPPQYCPDLPSMFH